MYLLAKLIYFIFLNMDLLGSTRRSVRNSPLSLAVLNIPTKNTLISMPSPSNDYHLLHHSKKKTTLAVYRIQLPKAKIFTNLEIYEWRHQTEFPIVKTRHVSVKGHTLQSQHVVEL